jgi:hypothetical protein
MARKMVDAGIMAEVLVNVPRGAPGVSAQIILSRVQWTFPALTMKYLMVILDGQTSVGAMVARGSGKDRTFHKPIRL